MIRNLIFKVIPILLAVVLLQLAVTSESQAQGGYDGYGGGYGHGGGYGGGYGGGFHYKVQYGDTLYAICRKFGVDPYYIAQVNGLPNPNHIYAGQVLYIPSGGGNCPHCQQQYPQPVHYPSHGQDCGNNCYQQSYWQQGCGNNCGQGCGNNCYQQSHWQQGCGNNCYQQSHWQQGCGNNCYQQSNWYGCGNDCYQQGAGYDYTGYYYDGYYPNYQRYSYTCGYNYNCY
ncbi:MAG TPA: LysM domain-containing protein [Anaerolineae bacterium]|nr:LysM domain-containing protein [Anaerolineae bacterium]